MTKMQLLLENTLEQDSASWLLNKYDIASVTNPTVDKDQDNKSISVLKANYTINGGTSMAVIAKYKGKEIQCVEMSDFPGKCRAIGKPPSHGIVMDAIVSGFGGDSTSSDNMTEADRGVLGFSQRQQEKEREKDREKERVQERAPIMYSPSVTPIGGDNGFYGCASPPCM